MVSVVSKESGKALFYAIKSWIWAVVHGEIAGSAAPWCRMGFMVLEGGAVMVLQDWLIEGFCTGPLVLVVELPTLDVLWELIFLMLL